MTLSLSQSHLDRLWRAESPLNRYQRRQSSSGATPRTASLQASPVSSPQSTSPFNSAPSSPVLPRKRNERRRDGDRFVASRLDFDADVAHYNLFKASSLDQSKLDTSPAKELYKSTLENMFFKGRTRSRLLETSGVPTTALRSHEPSIYEQTHSSGSSTQRKCHRPIPRAPYRILDAPEMIEDYYLNLLDWNETTNVLAVALNRAVYLWNADTCGIQKLLEMRAEHDSFVSSISWMDNGDYLAVGTSNGDVQLWDVKTLKKVRTLGGHRINGHSARVGSLSWNGYLLSSGSRDTTIFNSDVRLPEHHVSTFARHTQEVCGLRWSSDNQLASGGNDNLLCIWDLARANKPRYELNHHCAAVKGLAWCPWEANTLASGGGTADRHIRIWNTSTGACLNAVDTKSQVCSILWSKHYRELVSAHGYSQNQLIVWKYPSMVKVCELTGHTSRVLHMTMSPDGQTVCTGSGDATLRFWKTFEVTKKRADGDDSHALMQGMNLR